MHKLIKTVTYVSTRAFFCIRGQNHPLTFISGSHILTVSDYRVGVNDKFDRRAVYLGERFKASLSSCLLLLLSFLCPPQKVAGYYVIPSELLSVCPSVCPSVRPSVSG